MRSRKPILVVRFCILIIRLESLDSQERLAFVVDRQAGLRESHTTDSRRPIEAVCLGLYVHHARHYTRLRHLRIPRSSLAHPIQKLVPHARKRQKPRLAAVQAEPPSSPIRSLFLTRTFF